MGLSRTRKIFKIFRRKVEPRLIYSPFLRLILFNGWFQLGFGLFFLCLLAASLYLPKIWRVSPNGFLPEIKISFLDKTQNWALKRSARKYAAQGDFLRAARSWEGAVAQNPADESALRGYLSNCLRITRPDRQTLSAAAAQIPWLLRLAGTNLADVELAAAVCEHFEWPDLALYWLAPLADRLPPRADAVYTKALFQQGRIREFEARLDRAEASGDPQLRLYRLAWLAGFAPGSRGLEAERALRQAADSGQHTTVATRLLMITAATRHDPDLYRDCLARLARQDESTGSDQALYWILLAQTGRREEARRLAESYTTAPATSTELIHLTRAYSSLDLDNRARELFARFAPVFPNLSVWSQYAALLIRARDWDELRRVALRMREERNGQTTFWGYSYYLEGRVELEEKRLGTAEIAFNRAAEARFDLQGAALEVGRELTRLGYPKQGLQVLAGVEQAFAADPEYWNALFETGMALKDPAVVLKAAARCYELNPENIQNHNRYAAALLLNRTRPEEAIQLTLRLISKYPESPVAIINHASALLLNRRAAEARLLLSKLNPAELPLLERSAYYFALFEACADLSLWNEAWKSSDAINREYLFPIQQKWLEEKQKSMPVRVAAAGKSGH